MTETQKQMKQFLVHYRGPSGCDYTIGCAQKISLYSAESLEGVEEQLQTEFASAVSSGDAALSYLTEMYEGATIYEIVGECKTIDLLDLFKTLEVELSEKEKKRKEKEERKEYERLRKKFEGNRSQGV